ncbi:TetR/AcrR family transcriptional regulator [Streptomyces nitrosporeus]|uniref:TetR/AcrR family transcriptional regulator n=1 Tax=Streptomyces nitrosporeus TaxID=28894 RepID=A0A5J6FH33_9ACTN|nr:TetR/AcrR family transcriptional regulator [Streptomyces nitrosporeus]QEU74824.1 TetR/AcrR family transcriptional regulator [Streptomyces nitrosporeus]
MSETTRRGRPRSAAADQAILEATRSLLGSGGYAGVSMEAVAAEAGVGKPTVYRRWASKAALVADAVLTSEAFGAWEQPEEPAGSGDVGHDVKAWLRAHAERMTAPGQIPLVLALAAAAAESPGGAGEPLYRRLTGPRHRALVARLEAGVAAGQLRAGRDLDAVADALIGALLYQLLTGNAAASAARAEDLVETVLEGFRPAPLAETAGRGRG